MNILSVLKPILLFLTLLFFQINLFSQCVPPLVLTTSSTPSTCGLPNGTANVLITDPIGNYTYSWSPGGGTTATVTDLIGGNYTVIVTDENNCSVAGNVNVATSNPIALTTSSTPSQCNTSVGSASVVATGGTSPYTYSWSPSGGTGATASNVQAGNYTVTVTDANTQCTATEIVTVINSNAPLVDAIVTSTSCSSATGSGTAVLSVTGGTGNYTYLWPHNGSNSSSQTGLTAGSHIVIVMDGVCTVVKTIVIEKEQNTLNISPIAHAATCNMDNGSIIATFGAAPGPYIFEWTPNIGNTQVASDLAPGNYSVHVTDGNGCTGTGSASVIAMPTPVINILSISHPSCFGAKDGYYTYSVNGGPSFNSASIYGAGIHNETIGISGPGATVLCDVPYTVEFIEPPQITVSPTITSADCNIANGAASITATGGNAPYSYNWSSGGSAASVSGLPSGIVFVDVTDASGCVVTQPINIPTTGGQTLITNSTASTCGNGTATVTATGGMAPYSYAWLPGGQTISNPTGMAFGTYAVTVTDANGCAVSELVEIAPNHTLNFLSPVAGLPVATCNQNNGSLYPTVQGGQAPYTYLWMPGGETTPSITDLASGVYSVLVTDQNGCTGFLETTIGIAPAQEASIIDIQHPSCYGEWDGSYTLSWVTEGNQINSYIEVSGLPSGSYQGGIGGGIYNCQNYAPTIVLIDPPQLIASVASINGSCFTPGTATVTASGGTAPYTYIWFPSGGTAATASNLAPGSYTITVTDANGCSVEESVTITSSSTLLATSSSTPASCGLSDGEASITPIGGVAPYTYTWSPSVANTATASNLPVGDYTVTVTDASNCDVVETITVLSTSSMTATTSSTSASCGLPNGAATVTPSGGTAPYTYLWSPSGGTTATALNLVGGNYTVTVTDANDCSISQSVTVATTIAVTATISSTSTSCGLSNGSATVTPIGGTIPYTYAWSPIVGSTATASNLPAGNHSVLVTDANNCTVVQSVTIASSSDLTATISSTPTSCGLANGTAIVTPTSGVAPYTYVWSPNGGTSGVASNLVAGNYSVDVTDANNCTVNKTVTVASTSSISAVASSTPTSCGLASGSLSVLVTGGTAPYVYSWNPNGATTAIVSNVPAGNYTVTVTDANDCVATSTVTVSSSPLIVNSTTTPSTCDLSNGTATAIPINGAAPYTYVWSPNGGTSATASNLAAGNYTVIVTDANGCSTTTNVVITSVATPTVIINVTSPTCFGESNGSATAIVSGGSTPYTYSWTPSGENGLTASNLAAGNQTLTVTDGKGCVQTHSVNITQPLPIIVTTMENPADCNGTLGSLNATSSGGTGTISYVWEPGNFVGPAHSGISAGVYSVTATDANGCSTTATSTVAQTGSLLIDVNPPTSWIDEGDTVELIVTDVPGATYSWSPSTGLSCSDCANPLATPNGGTVYTVTVTAPNGCIGTTDAVINLNINCTELFIPTIFSPNGDGNNDQFLVMGNCIVDINMKIYDRWGEKVFESNDLSLGWDGNYKGQPMNPASFVYVVSLTFIDGTSKVEKGNLALVK